MDVTYINPLIAATREVFDTMIHVPICLGKPFLRDRTLPIFKISTSIQLSGPVSGIVVIQYTDQVARALIAAFTKAPAAELDENGLDALGEIANMIAGSAKKNLPGGLSELGLPKIHQSPEAPTYPIGLPVIVVPCDTAPGRFNIEVSLYQKSRPAPVVPRTDPEPAAGPAEKNAVAA